MQRFYRISDPLGISWRRFRALVFNLPPDSAFMTRIRIEREDADEMSPTNVMDYIDKQKGRRYDETRRSSMSQFGKGVS